MADRRHRNGNWIVGNVDGKVTTWEEVQVSLLMDIRDELQALNSKLNCWRIQKMFSTIERMDKRLAKKAKLR